MLTLVHGLKGTNTTTKNFIGLQICLHIQNLTPFNLRVFALKSLQCDLLLLQNMHFLELQPRDHPPYFLEHQVVAGPETNCKDQIVNATTAIIANGSNDKSLKKLTLMYAKCMIKINRKDREKTIIPLSRH